MFCGVMCVSVCVKVPFSWSALHTGPSCCLMSSLQASDMGDAILFVSCFAGSFGCVWGLGLPVDSSLSEWVVFPLYFQLCFHGPRLFWICSEVCPDRCSMIVSDCSLVVSVYVVSFL